jgi:transcriptional regulator with XRE-family HTH domain
LTVNPLINQFSESVNSPKRKRGVILSSQGWQRLQAAEHLLAVRENGADPFTLEQLSDLTGLSSKTVTKVRHREKPVDQITLQSYFQGFRLTLSPDDYISQEPREQKSLAVLANLLQSPLKGQLALNSPFYIYRPQAENLLKREILQPGALIRIRAPRQFGKTSLVAQGLAHAEEHGYRRAIVSVQMADSSIYQSLDNFLQWLCATIARSLGLPHRLDELWQPIFGSSYSCNEYFETYLLPAEDSPLLLVIDEVNEVFNYPKIAHDFFGLLRAWYERSRHSNQNSEIWQKLRLTILYSTDVFLPINIHQSPFNVGLLIKLSPFTVEQVQELAIRYGLTYSRNLSQKLVTLLGGNPYLTQLALFHLSQENVTIDKLYTKIITPDSIFESHLRQQLTYLERYPELKNAIRAIVREPKGIKLYPTHASKLQGLGLIQFKDQLAQFSCKLYQVYFTAALE